MADDPLDPPRDHDAEVELDIRAFLPEGTDLDGDWGDDAPAPEVPAWARADAATATDTDAAPTVAGAPSEPTVEAASEVSGEAAETGPEEKMDLSVLEGIEADLIEVDEAIAALDAGEPTSSALLRRLVQAPPAP